MTPEEALSNIFPTVEELNTVITREHLIDDYALSCNIARFGLKATTIIELKKLLGMEENTFHFHLYTIPIEQKVIELNKMLEHWKIPDKIRGYGG